MSAKVETGICLGIPDGVQVCVPDDVQLMTPYILQEQLDWFEDEIKFLRHVIAPGQRVLDIGANYGVYSLAAAKAVGPAGMVTSFEPFPATANWLRRSVEVNGFLNMRIVEAALSDKAGHGWMVTSENSELNRLTQSVTKGGGQTVVVTTLDDSLRESGWEGIDFVKIDAEGHETNVIEGGRRLFETLSPLVMFEIKADDKIDLGPLRLLESMGYSAYRLIPGLNLLEPYESGGDVDGYQLNLFACKPDRAARLAEDGHLVPQGTRGLREFNGDEWGDYLSQFPYGRLNAGIWKLKTSTQPIPGWGAYERVLNACAIAYSATESPSTRYAYLIFAFQELSSLLGRAASLPRLLTFVRVAADLGLRQRAVATLQHIMAGFQRGLAVAVDEPFLPVSPDLERVEPGDSLKNWVLASVLERFVTLGAFSSYFAPSDATAAVPRLAELGFPTKAMERRLSLVRRRFPSA